MNNHRSLLPSLPLRGNSHGNKEIARRDSDSYACYRRYRVSHRGWYPHAHERVYTTTFSENDGNNGNNGGHRRSPVSISLLPFAPDVHGNSGNRGGVV